MYVNGTYVPPRKPPLPPPANAVRVRISEALADDGTIKPWTGLVLIRHVSRETMNHAPGSGDPKHVLRRALERKPRRKRRMRLRKLRGWR